MASRDIAPRGSVTLQGRDEDVVRTKFRLSLVLQAQEKLEEASAIQKEIATSLENIRSPVSVPSNYTDEDDMKLSRLCDLGFSWSESGVTGRFDRSMFQISARYEASTPGRRYRSQLPFCLEEIILTRWYLAVHQKDTI